MSLAVDIRRSCRTSHRSKRYTHPDPLRSHSIESFSTLPYIAHTRSTSQLLWQTESQEDSARPESPTISSPKPNHRHNRTLSQQAIGLPPTWGLPPMPVHPAHRPLPEERLGDGAMAAASDSSPVEADLLAITPTRTPRSLKSPLRSKVSFGGISRFSYYSEVSSTLEQKSRAVAAEEEVREKRRQSLIPATSAWKALVCLVVLVLLSFVFGLSTSCLAASLPIVAQSLDIGSMRGFWLASSFLTTRALAQPIAARITTISGPNPVVLLGCLAYGIGCIINVTAQSYAALLAGRCLEGLGSGVVTSVSLTLVHRLSGNKQQRSNTVISTVYWLGVALGPIVGAVSTVAWRGIFGTNAWVGIISFAVLPFVLLPPETRGRPFGYRHVDYLGWILLSSSIVGVLVVLSWGGVSGSWNSGQVLAPLIICLVLFGSWVLHACLRSDGVIPISVLRNAAVLRSCSGSLILGILYTAVLYLVPLYFITVKDLRPVVSGSVLSAWTFSMVMAYLVAAALPNLFQKRLTALVSWAMLAIALGITVLLQDDTPTAAPVPLGLACGAAMGLLHSTFFASLSPEAEKHEGGRDADLPLYQGVHSFCHSLGQAFGLAICSCIFLNIFAHSLPPTPMTSAQDKALDAIAMARIMSLEDLHLQAYTTALQYVWIFCCALASLAFLASAAATALHALGVRDSPATSSRAAIRV